MNKLVVFFVFIGFTSFAQLTVDRLPPYDSPVFLVDEVLLGSGVNASNHSYQGDSIQIGFFDGSASNIGLGSGIVMATGDIAILDPTFAGFGDFVDVNPAVTDPDLLDVANSVPGLIGQNFQVSSVNDIAVLEFDFVPSSDTLSFRYVFGSQEYFGYENSVFNDVFGFFISGPGIVGPYASPAAFPDGSINIATFESQEANSLGVELPITISSICNFPDDWSGASVYNPQLFVDNQALTTVGDADGFTVVMSAIAAVQCGETYHIRLAIADGTDTGLSSYVFLEENSFSSPYLEITNSLQQDSSHILIDCGTTVDLTAEITGSTDFTYQWNSGQNTSTISVGEGEYVVEATSGNNCTVLSDTFYVVEVNTTEVELGDDMSVCENDEVIIEPVSFQATSPSIFSWSSGQNTASISAPAGEYIVTLTDANGCIAQDTIIVNTIVRPTATLSGGGTICEGQSFSIPLNLELTGNAPYYYSYSDGSNTFNDTAFFDNFIINASNVGEYSLISINDIYCSGSVDGSANISSFILPKTTISGGDIICEGDSVEVTLNVESDALPYNLLLNNGDYNQLYSSIDQNTFTFYLSEPSTYFVDKVIDSRGCYSVDNQGEVSVSLKEYKNPDIITSIDSVICAVDEPFELQSLTPGGVWRGKGLGFDNYYYPIDAYIGTNWLYYSFPNNCNETDSIAIEVGCNLTIFVPNTFTPNGDDENELFFVKGNNVITFELSIYDRWGELMFNTKDINATWDGKFRGKVVPTGTYSYVYTAYGKDAQTVNKSGTINIFR